MSDLQKIIIACLLTAMATCTLTIAAGWMAIIRDHIKMCATVENVKNQQKVRWEKLSVLEDKVAKLEAKWDYLERGN